MRASNILGVFSLLAFSTYAIACSSNRGNASGAGQDGTPASPQEACSAYVACVAEAQPEQLAATLAAYGPNGACFAQGAESVAKSCGTACETLRAAIREKIAIPACGRPLSPEEAMNANPYGRFYPKGDYGLWPRDSTRPGARFPPFRLSGYPDGDARQGIKEFSMVQFYDPEARHHSVVMVVICAPSIEPCHRAAASLRDGAPTRRRLLAVEVLTSGTTFDSEPSVTALDAWMRLDPPPSHTVANDVNGRFDAFSSAVPAVTFLDARSMEILQLAGGWTERTLDQADEWVDWVSRNPPQL
jgi:hypothetical protein